MRTTYPSAVLGHLVTVHEGPEIGGRPTLGVECLCGERAMCFWGEPQVERWIDSHFFRHGVEKRVTLL